MIKAFIVDDEEHALNILELFLQRTGEVEVVGRSSNGFDALAQLAWLKPDVLFLDIEMPEMNGLELAELVRNNDGDVRIVFATAYDQYAISAFELAAADYILKPLEAERLAKTIARIRKEIGKSGGAGERTETPEGADKLTIRLFGQLFAGVGEDRRMKWRTSKEKELLAYLASREDKRVHRDLIIEALWPDESYSKAKIYLHTCISLLRKNLKQLGFDGIVKYENEGYYLEADRVDVDARAFKQRVRELKRSGDPEPAGIEEALALHRGPFLQEGDYLWAEQEAEALENSAREWRLALAEIRLRNAEFEKATGTAELAVESSPYDEEAYRLLMRGYRGLGKHDQVHAVYRRLVGRLEELRVKPSEASRRLYEEIRG